MISLQVKFEDKTKALKKKIKEGTLESLGQAGGAIRLTARRSLRPGRGKRALAKGASIASDPGSPPFSPTRLLKNSILYQVEDENVIVGPNKKEISLIGNVHEFGGVEKGRRYPARPFMGPAFEKLRPRLAKFWADSITN
jgi:phage gpG-like protein